MKVNPFFNFSRACNYALKVNRKEIKNQNVLSPNSIANFLNVSDALAAQGRIKINYISFGRSEPTSQIAEQLLIKSIQDTPDDKINDKIDVCGDYCNYKSYLIVEACMINSLKAVQLLLERDNIKVNVTDENENYGTHDTPLMIASWWGNVDMVSALLENKDIDVQTPTEIKFTLKEKIIMKSNNR